MFFFDPVRAQAIGNNRSSYMQTFYGEYFFVVFIEARKFAF